MCIILALESMTVKGKYIANFVINPIYFAVLLNTQGNNMNTPILCPRAILQYNCSFYTAVDSLTITWYITFPGRQTVTVSYDQDSTVNIVQTFSGIESRLSRYFENEYVESVISLEVLTNLNVQCVVNDFPAVDANSSVFRGKY